MVRDPVRLIERLTEHDAGGSYNGVALREYVAHLGLYPPLDSPDWQCNALRNCAHFDIDRIVVRATLIAH